MEKSVDSEIYKDIGHKIFQDNQKYIRSGDISGIGLSDEKDQKQIKFMYFF